MRSSTVIILKLAEGLMMLVAAWQIMTLFPIYSWFANLDAVTPAMWAAVAVKVIVLAIAAVLWWGIKRIRRKIEATPE